MWKHKLCMYTDSTMRMSVLNQIRTMKEVGFDGFVADWSGDINKYAKESKRIGMYFLAIRMPSIDVETFCKKEKKEGERFIGKAIQAVQVCGEHSIPAVILTITGELNSSLTSGCIRLQQLMEEGEKNRVRIVVENSSGVRSLDSIIKTFYTGPALGYCWNVGLELCHPYGDRLTPYAEKLFLVCLNDNLGIRNYEGKTDLADDSRLLPFDGIGDWENVMRRLKKINYSGAVILDVSKKSRKGRFDNDSYQILSDRLFIVEAYKRACRLGGLWERV